MAALFSSASAMEEIIHHLDYFAILNGIVFKFNYPNANL